MTQGGNIKHYIYVIVIIFIPIILYSQRWQNDYRVTQEHQNAYTSLSYTRSIAVSPNGVLYSVWFQLSNEPDINYDIYYARSRDCGESWPFVRCLYNDNGQAYWTSIAVYGSNIHIVWSVGEHLYDAGKVCYAYSPDDGETWYTEELYSNPVCYYPTITVNNIGAVNVIWIEYGTQIRSTYRRSPDDPWLPFQTIYNPGCQITAASISSEGSSQRVHIAVSKWMSDPQELIYLRSENQGNSWDIRSIYRASSSHIIEYPSISTLNDNVLVTWHEIYGLYQYIKNINSYNGGINWEVEARDLDIAYQIDLTNPSIIIDLANIVHVIWSRDISYYNYEIYYRRSLDKGISWQPKVQLTDAGGDSYHGSIACNPSSSTWSENNKIYILWQDHRQGESAQIYFKRGWQIGVDATYPNQGRHLSRVINTEDCHLVFQGENGLFWQPKGEVLYEPAGLCDGKYPTVAVTHSRGIPWVGYVQEIEEIDVLYCRINRNQNPNDWKEIRIERTENIEAPSLILATNIPGDPQDLGYIVYTKRENNNSYICFSAFDSLRRDPYCTMVLDNGFEDALVSSPSIAITPGDFIHVVWQKVIDGQEKIYYTTSDKVSPEGIRNGILPTWSEPFNVSYFDLFPTEPATNPFVEAYGDKVSVVWRGPNGQGNPEYGDIWQRQGIIYNPGNPPEWRDPWNVSETEDRESNYPVMSTDVFTSWQEMDHGNWEIKLKYNNDPPYNVSNSPTPSKYPHINALITEYERPIVYALWTEEFQPDMYEAKFLRFQYPPEQDNEDDEIIYYPVSVGKPVQSIYCLQRDGYIPYSNFPIDYGTNHISYKLDYLNPAYYYKARAVVYHNNNGQFGQRFYFDDIQNATVNFQPGVPETVEIYIPQATYNQTLNQKLKLNAIKAISRLLHRLIYSSMKY